MKHHLIDMKISNCKECLYFEFPKQAVYPLCHHPLKPEKWKGDPVGGIVTDNFAFPEWCPWDDCFVCPRKKGRGTSISNEVERTYTLFRATVRRVSAQVEFVSKD